MMESALIEALDASLHAHPIRRTCIWAHNIPDIDKDMRSEDMENVLYCFEKW
jgi:hypothetical protein